MRNATRDQPQLSINFDLPHDFVDVGHSRLAHWCIGAGPDLVFVHGWPLHSATFRDIAPLLGRNYRCHLLDLPGAGRSEWTERSPAGLQEHADTLKHAIHELALERFSFVAHDTGAAIARLVAAELPDQVEGLVLSDTEIPGHLPWLVYAYSLATRLPGILPIFAAILRTRVLRRSSLALGNCFEDKDHLDGPFAKHFLQPLIDSPRALAGQLMLLANLNFDVVNQMERTTHRQIRAPVQLIWGPNDSFFPVAKARVMASQFPAGAEFITLKAGKIFAHEEFPEAYSEHAQAFLGRTLRS